MDSASAAGKARSKIGTTITVHNPNRRDSGREACFRRSLEVTEDNQVARRKHG
jgi:hypothetical protein